jgi:hypothetical protein
MTYSRHTEMSWIFNQPAGSMHINIFTPAVCMIIPLIMPLHPSMILLKVDYCHLLHVHLTAALSHPLNLLICSHPMWFPVLCLLVLPSLPLPRNKRLLGPVAWVLQNCNPTKHITARNRQTDLILMRWTIN